MKYQVSYTLLEILVTLGIITIISLLSIPLSYKTDHDNLAHELHHLFSLISYLQQQAMATNQTIALTFDPEHNNMTYAMIGQKPITHHLAGNLIFGAPATILGPPAHPSKPITQAISFGASPLKKPQLQCNPSGNLSAGTLYISNHTLTQIGALTCGIGHVSYIRTYIYKHGTWKVIHEQ